MPIEEISPAVAVSDVDEIFKQDDLDRLFNGELTVAQWLNAGLAKNQLSPMDKNQFSVGRYLLRLDELLQQIELAEIRKESEFNLLVSELSILLITQQSTARKFQDCTLEPQEKQQLPSVRDLRISIRKVQTHSDRLINDFGQVNYDRIKSLVGQWKFLRQLLDIMPAELQWRREVSQMECSLTALDADVAQLNLEQLDKLLASNTTPKRVAQLRTLRKKLIAMIKSNL